MVRPLLVLASLLLLSVAGCLEETAPDDGLVPTPAPDADDVERPEDRRLGVLGRWLEPFEGEVAAINMVVLHDGRVLYWSGVEARSEEPVQNQTFFTSYPHEGESRVLDLSGDAPTITTPGNATGAAGDLFCSGQTILPDGRALTAGGSGWHNAATDLALFLDGIPDARVFDPATDEWTRVADMQLGRWYPSLLTTPDGTGVAASGIGNLATFSEQWPNWEAWDEDAEPGGRWGILEGTDGHLLPLYPRLHVVPGGDMAGRAFYSTAGTLWGPFGEHPQQSEWSFMKSYDIEADAWHEHERSQFGARQYASSVLLPAGPDDDHAATVLSHGGTLQQGFAAVPFSELIDLSGPEPVTRQGPDLVHARWHHNSVLLPDGDVLVVGGGTYDNVIAHGQQNEPILEAESFDPETEAWTELAPMAVPRMYHSSAVLLPDGRVLAGGHVPLPVPDQTHREATPQVVETRLEIYEPGYLFRGERPVVEAAPAAISYGQRFEVRVDFDGTIDSVMLMHPGSTTHAYDSGQKATWLRVVEQGGGRLVLEAPPSAVVTQPGYHMLFVNGEHEQGPVPSVAAWVRLSDAVRA